QARAQALSKAFGRIEGNIIETVQFIDDHHLDDLIDGCRSTCRHIVVLMVHLVNQISTEQPVHSCGPADFVMISIALQALTNQRALETRARNTVERDIKDQEVAVQGQSRYGPE